MDRVGTELWKVDLVDHGSQARLLSSSHLGSFETGAILLQDIIIQGNLFARSLLWLDGSCTEVFDWTKSTSTTHHKATVLTETEGVSLLYFLLFMSHPSPGHTSPSRESTTMNFAQIFGDILIHHDRTATFCRSTFY